MGVFGFPAHTPDNSFLGFVVGSNQTNSLPPSVKRDIGLVYGKELYMWRVLINVHAVTAWAMGGWELKPSLQ